MQVLLVGLNHLCMEQFNVLSVCGQIALQELNIKVDNYFASEIDKSAIKVTRHNFPNTSALYAVASMKQQIKSRCPAIA